MNKQGPNIKKLLSLLFHRTVVIAVLIALQITVLMVAMYRFSGSFVYLYWIFLGLSALSVLIVVNRQTDPGYKIAWLILIMIFPVLGWLFYLVCGGNRLSGRARRKMQVVGRKMVEVLERDCKAEELDRYGEDAANQSRYLERYAHCPAYANTRTEYFPLGDQVFPRMLEELKKARRYIFIEYFILEHGLFWDSVLEVLKERYAAGVDVRVIYDDVGCLHKLPVRYAAKFTAETGIPCRAFNRFRPMLSIHMNNRDHRKLMIVDGHTAFTGGVNLADEYINLNSPYGHWKDSAILVQGEAAWSMTVMFLTMWDYILGLKEDYGTFRPGSPPPEAARGADFYVQPYTDTPLDNEPVGEMVYLNLINKARRYVYITTPYLIVSDSLNTALCGAAKAGVDVRIITPHIPDKKLVFELTRAHYEPLLEAGVRIFEYTPGFVHAKNFAVDDVYGTVGTVNLDYRSMFLHFENGVWLCHDPSVLDIKADFLDTQEKSMETTLAQCRGRSWPRRLLRALLRIVAPLL